MQSFLQHRRFRKAIENELSTDREKGHGAALDDATISRLTNIQSSRHQPPDATGRSLEAEDAETLSKEETADSLTNAPTEGLESFSSSSTESDFRSRTATQNQELPYDLRPEVSRLPTGAGASRYVTRVATVPTARLERSITSVGRSLTGVEVRKRTTNEGKGEPGLSTQVFVVGYEGADDELNPHNWPRYTKIYCCGIVASTGFIVGVASAIDSSVLEKAASDFGVSAVVESLATGLYLAGFGVGAIFAGPISETLGRNPVYIGSLVPFMIFVMASGLAPNIGAQLAFRWLAGFFGSTPLVCAGGSISDIFDPLERVVVLPVYAIFAFTGPMLGPVIGGFIADTTQVSWRWTEWTTLIGAGIVFSMVTLFLPETFPPILLKWRASHLRSLTGDKRFRAPVEIRESTFFSRLKTATYRPFIMLFTEPIIMVLAAYLTIVYVIIFTFLDGYNYIYGETYGVPPSIEGLCFLGVVVGLFFCFGLLLIIFPWAKQGLEELRAGGNPNAQLPPEFRLWWAMLGPAFAIPISLLWMGWTARSSISIWSPIIASSLFGFGILGVFICCYQYIIDAYEAYSASALAAVTLVRYVASGGMTVAGLPFYSNVGVAWSCTILGVISALMVPTPFVLYRFGKKIRASSKHAPKKDN